MTGFRRFLITDFEGRRGPSLMDLDGAFPLSEHSLVRLTDHSLAPTCEQDRRERRRGQGGSAPQAWMP